MKISRVKINNFRSLRDVEFSITDFNILVGQNNCGKTNFFEAIEFFFNGPGKNSNVNDFKFRRQAELELRVEVEFSGALEGAAHMRNDTNRTRIESKLNGADTVIISRTSVDAKKRIMHVSGQEVTPGTGFDAALNDFLPKFEYISTKQYYDSVAKYTKTTPIGQMLSGVLSTILEGNEQYRQFQEKFRELFEDDGSEIRAQFEAIGNRVKLCLERQFPDTTKVEFQVTAPAFDDLLKNFETTVDDGVETLAEEKGDGMQRALMLAIIQVYAEYRKANEDIGRSFLFFIDEAELHLHPTAQRKLKTVLHSLSAAMDQVFINTHSSVFVADECERQSIFKVEKSNGETEVKKIVETEKPYVVFELLGGSPADLLLPRNFLIVEGQSELEFFRRIINRFYSDKPSIQIIMANGDIDQAERTINAIEKIFGPLNQSIYKDHLVILGDHPSPELQAGVEDFHRRYPHLRRNSQFFELAVRDLEQYYPNHPDPTYGNWRKTQADIDATNASGKKIFTGHKKKQLAKFVGEHISQTEFESDMPACHQALSRCWALVY